MMERYCLHRVALLFLLTPAVGYAQPRSEDTALQNNQLLSTLVAASKAGKRFSQVSIGESLQKTFVASDARRFIEGNPDFSAYHVLMYLRQRDAETWQLIPADTRARVLCSAMKHTIAYNDWGMLGPDIDQAYNGGIADKAILELRRDAIPHLRLLLDDKTIAPIVGSEEATVADELQFRLCDYAYRYIMLILGRKPAFPDKPAERDRFIDELRNELGAR
jgi:hypothetical protein